jgi:O-antigen/teichoic acid export membrane protein
VRRALLKDILAYMPARVVPVAMAVIWGAVLTRVFRPAEFADFTLFTTISSTFLTFAISWAGSSAIRYLPGCAKNADAARLARRILGLASRSIAMTLVLFAGIYVVLRERLPPTLRSLVFLGTVTVIVQAYNELLLSMVRGRGNPRAYTAALIVNSIGGVGLGLVFVAGLGLRVEGLLYGVLAVTAVTGPWTAWHAVRTEPGPAAEGPLARELITYGLPSLFIAISSSILGVSDRYFLVLMRGSHDVGIYAANYALGDRPVAFLNSMFTVATTPLGFKVWERQGAEATRVYLRQLMRMYLLIGVPATIGLSVLARPIANVLLGEQFRDGAGIIPVVAVSLFFLGVAHRYTIVFGFFKKNSILMICFLASGLLNVGLNVVFIPRYGYWAAAYSTLVGYAALLAMAHLASRRHLHWSFPVASLVRTCSASLAMALVLLLFGRWVTLPAWIHLAMGMAVGATVYAGALLLVGEITADERERVREIIRVRLAALAGPGR